MRAIGVIPARFGSTRFKGKVLADIAGKPMIQHVWARAKTSKLLGLVIVACDDTRVKKACEKFGARAVMTSKSHESGSDRIAEAVKSLSCDVVVNIQGDEPLIHPSMIDSLVRALDKDKKCFMATLIKRIKNTKEINDPNVVKVAVDKEGYALYFSRSAIPFNREKSSKVSYFKHFGLYAYRKSFLMGFKKLPASGLEKIERLEQLRVLEAGYKIKTVETRFDTIAVDTKQDLNRVKAYLRRANRRE